jgi:Cft2 family RNA processing exonuclease
MNITFLGGGNEIGASCAIVEIGQSRVLVDCGIRMTGDNRLPDLATIKNSSRFSHLDAVILTHAHTDHSGALPVLHQHFPAVPIYCTASTKGLVEVLLRDSLNVMRAKAEEENELPLFAKGAVESLVENLIPVPFGSPTQLGRSKVTATWFPAGHILGASSVGIEGVENNRTIKVLFSGDISVGEQLTVAGMLAPKDFRPDVLVIESTYGDRLHSPRDLEERRMIEMVAGIIERKGKLLIPAFAVGRAQEIILMLLKEFRAKRLKKFPVYVDGMVRSVCGVYSSFPSHQTEFTRRLIEKHGNPFFNIVDEVQQVASPNDREKILSGESCCIVASSGMLSGGASAFYAPTIAADERNGIAITGYQDEESPGRALLNLADGQTKELNIAGHVVEVKSSVAKYSLSAHADANEIAGLIEAINPRQIVLVHGEGQARPALADMLRRTGGRYRPIHLPRTGDTLAFGATRRTTTNTMNRIHVGFGNGEELTNEGLKKIADEFKRHDDKKKLYSEVELLNFWYGQNSWEEDEYTALVKLLDEGEVFRRHPTRSHLFRMRRDESEEESATMFYAEPNELLQIVENAFGANAGLYKKGYDLANHELRLSFHFPLIAKERYRELLQRTLEGTGWTYSINEKPHQERVIQVAQTCLPAGLLPAKTPAWNLETGTVTIKLNETISDTEHKQAIKRFKDETGYVLKIETPFIAEDISTETPLVEPIKANAPAEINIAYWIIDEAFADAPETWRPYKKSLKIEGNFNYIEVAFISPQIGLQQNERLQQAAKLTGRHLRVKPEPNQIKLLEILSQVVPREWGLQKSGIHKGNATIQLKLLKTPEDDSQEWIEVKEKFFEMTGYRLEK